jgi:pantothenate kinase
MSADYNELTTALINAYTNQEKRFLLGITGIPGAGKSTMAAALAKRINETLTKNIAIVVPMDGFHLHNDILKKRGLFAQKGAPETFDAEGFTALIKQIALDRDHSVYCPAYNRNLHNPVPNAVLVEKHHRIIIIEGNYLLLPTAPWQELKNFFSETWFIDISPTITKQRLIRRHMRSGRPLHEALTKIDSTDMPNAKLILNTKPLADKIITLV